VRIVGGVWRGRRLVAPAGRAVRPTSDQARETLFNVLEHGPAFADFALAGARVIDLFAGTGALGLEALSRGAAEAIFIDDAPSALEALRRNIAALDAADRARMVMRDATRPGAAPAACGLALLDPPYRSGLAAPALVGLATAGWLESGTVAVVELAKREAFEPPTGFAVAGDRATGAARLVFLKWSGP